MEPVECLTCGSSFKPSEAKRKYCSRKCYGISKRSDREDVRYKLVHRPDHPLAPRGGTFARARIILYEKIGPGATSCTWCDKALKWAPGQPYAPDGIIADHLDFDPTNDSADNLVAACRTCNGRRREPSRDDAIREGELFVTYKNGARTRAKELTCRQCGGRFTVPLSAKSRFCGSECYHAYVRS